MNEFDFQLDCCGWDGPKEFAYNSEPIDDTCYENVGQANSGVVPRPEDQFSAKKMKQVRTNRSESLYFTITQPFGFFLGRLWTEVVHVVRREQDHLGDRLGLRGSPSSHVHRDRELHHFTN